MLGVVRGPKSSSLLANLYKLFILNVGFLEAFDCLISVLYSFHGNSNSDCWPLSRLGGVKAKDSIDSGFGIA